MNVDSRVLPLLALCGWIALVPVLGLEDASLRVPIVTRCSVSVSEAVACGWKATPCAADSDEDVPVPLKCCICLQFGALSMLMSQGAEIGIPTLVRDVPTASSIDPTTRNSRPPVPPPQSA
jgi:hypothetical protein